MSGTAKSIASLKERSRAPKIRAASGERFTVVGIGASAGGLEAFQELLRHLPSDTGMAFVFIQHLHPEHSSQLAEILGRSTRMIVQEAMDGLKVHPNRLYIISPNTSLRIETGVLRVDPREAPIRGVQLPIDAFFHSLANDQQTCAIGVVLSGSATDGSQGLRSIKAQGGITFAQDSTARFDSMPRSAVAVGAVDYVLPPNEIAAELVRLARHSYVVLPVDDQTKPSSSTREVLGKIFSLLQGSHDVDFTHYKPTTVERRIRRRMAIGKFDTLESYLEHLRASDEELHSLYTDILIRVTGFFRDESVFEYLQQKTFPAILEKTGARSQIRIWVPGCSTGEEVYSLAIAMAEVMARSGMERTVQFFGTDISEASVSTARSGIYPDNVASELSEERLRTWFVRIDGHYRVAKAIRDKCIFARQNLAQDAPFSRLDMISCRNVMIYLGATLQSRVMNIFHFALKPDGYLLLGTSESVGRFGELFSVTDRRNKVFQKKPLATPALPAELSVPNAGPRTPRAVEEVFPRELLFREADRLLLSKFAPAGVVVNDQMEILQFRGRTSPFLEPAPGSASFDLLKMTREGLLADLRSAFRKVRNSDNPVHKEGIPVTTDGGGSILVSLDVLPFSGVGKDRCFLVLFSEEGRVAQKDSRPAGKAAKKKKSQPEAREKERLRKELEATREYLQSIVEEQESMNEELRSANEEIQSSNEELQSTNEELETAKEELQSTNEELTTVNEELENRNQILDRINNDLYNLFGSIDIPVLILDHDLRIRRFTPSAEKVLNLAPLDVGRVITDVKLHVDLKDLPGIVGEVVETLREIETDVQDRSGRWYSVRVRPYRTTDNRIEGSVLAFVDVDDAKRGTYQEKLV